MHYFVQSYLFGTTVLPTPKSIINQELGVFSVCSSKLGLICSTIASTVPSSMEEHVHVIEPVSRYHEEFLFINFPNVINENCMTRLN